MNKMLKALTCLAFSISSVTVSAQSDNGWWSGIYAGGSYGTGRISSGAHVSFEDLYVPPVDPIDDPNNESAGSFAGPYDYYSKKQKPSAIELFAGYDILEFLGGDIGVEGRLNFSMTQNIQTITDVSASAAGLYGVYKTTGDAYVAARLGLGSTKLDFSDVNVSSSGTGLSYGISLGQKIFGGALEITYMRYPDVKLEQADRTIPIEMEFENTIQSGVLMLDKRIEYESLTFGYVYSF